MIYLGPQTFFYCVISVNGMCSSYSEPNFFMFDSELNFLLFLPYLSTLMSFNWQKMLFFVVCDQFFVVVCVSANFPQLNRNGVIKNGLVSWNKKDNEILKKRSE